MDPFPLQCFDFELVFCGPGIDMAYFILVLNFDDLTLDLELGDQNLSLTIGRQSNSRETLGEGASP